MTLPGNNGYGKAFAMMNNDKTGSVILNVAGSLLSIAGIAVAMLAWRWDCGLFLLAITGLVGLLSSAEYEPTGLLGAWWLPILYAFVAVMAGHEAGASFLAMALAVVASFLGGLVLGRNQAIIARKQLPARPVSRFFIV